MGKETISDAAAQEAAREIFNAEEGTYWAAIRDFAFIVEEGGSSALGYGGELALAQMLYEKVVPVVLREPEAPAYTSDDAGVIGLRLMDLCRAYPRSTS